MPTLPGLQIGVTKDPSPPIVDTLISPQSIPNGTTLITTKTTNETIDNVDQLIRYVSGDNGPNFIPQTAIVSLLSDLAAKELTANKVTTIGTPGNDVNYGTEKAIRDELNLKEDSLGFTPENSANKGIINGYAGLDGFQELLLANFPSGDPLQVLRRNAGNTESRQRTGLQPGTGRGGVAGLRRRVGHPQGIRAGGRAGFGDRIRS